MWRARLVVTAVWVEGRSKSQVAHDDQVGQLLVVTGDLAEAEDVLQEAFARAVSRWASLQGYDVPEAWVRRVELSLTASGPRRRRKRLAALLQLGPPPVVPAVSADTAAVAQGTADPAGRPAATRADGEPAPR
jgi:DNA-directed RNA polymerase specialized sigma24 family protein